MERVLLILVFIFSYSTTWANSCCGQSPSSFSVLSLEQKLNLSTSYTASKSYGRVFNSDELYIWEDKERSVQSIKLMASSAFANRQQAFISGAFVQGTYSDHLGSEHSQHFSDILVGYTYELLPEYTYSAWKPLIYVSLLTNLPTGKSIYDSSSLSEGADVTGLGQWGMGLGVTIKKVYFPLTLTIQTKSLRIFPEDFASVSVSGLYDHSFAFLANYSTNFYQLAFNVGITSNYLSSRTISTSNTSSGSVQNTNLIIGLQRVFNDSWSGGITYSDQRLLGKARNTILNQSLSLNINYTYF